MVLSFNRARVAVALAASVLAASQVVPLAAAGRSGGGYSSSSVGSCLASGSTRYGATVVANTPLEQGLNAVSDVLRAPDNAVAEFANVGMQGGYVTIAFANGVRVVNGAGDDLIVHIKDFLIGEDERFQVFVSQDGGSFVNIGTRNPSQTVPMQQLALPFDIGSSGLAYVTQVKIANIRGGQKDWEGVDIDAIEARNVQCPPSSSSKSSSSSSKSSAKSSSSSSKRYGW